LCVFRRRPFAVNFPVITDPLFYLCAIPSVLLLGVSKSGFGIGIGSLAVPLMALTISVPQAAAIMMPVLLFVDLLGLAAFRKNIDVKFLRFLIPFGLLGTLLGALFFKSLDTHLVAGLVGGLTLLFLAQRLLFPPRADSAPPPRWVGAVLTTVSGFTSFVAHSGGPPISAYVIPLRLSPLHFASTMAYFFFVINLSKWIPFALLGLLDDRNMATSLVLLPLVPIGVFVGFAMAKHISPLWFNRLILWGMGLTGVKLLWDAFH
jgi:uncharacterized membrane protein YfcA